MPLQTQARVLYVDNDNDSREMMSTLLGISKIDVTAVANAESALSLIQAERFDLYVLDSWLSDTDGFELCRLMLGIHPNTPVMFFSGAAYDTDKRRGFEAGASAYVCKPDVEEMLGSITQFVSHAQGVAA